MYPQLSWLNSYYHMLHIQGELLRPLPGSLSLASEENAECLGPFLTFSASPGHVDNSYCLLCLCSFEHQRRTFIHNLLNSWQEPSKIRRQNQRGLRNSSVVTTDGCYSETFTDWALYCILSCATVSDSETLGLQKQRSLDTHGEQIESRNPHL